MNKYIQILYLSMALGLVALPHAVAKSGDKDHPEPPAKKARNTAAPRAVLEQQALAALNSQLQGISLSGSNVMYKSSASFLAEGLVSTPVKATRDSANTLFKKLERENKLLDMDANGTPSLSPIKFPIGLKKHFGANNIVYVGFSRAVLKPNSKKSKQTLKSF
jgi:hypothetical protein